MKKIVQRMLAGVFPLLLMLLTVLVSDMQAKAALNQADNVIEVSTRAQLEDAFRTLEKADGTILLLSDIHLGSGENEGISIYSNTPGRKITLALNGHTVTYGANKNAAFSRSTASIYENDYGLEFTVKGPGAVTATNNGQCFSMMCKDDILTLEGAVTVATGKNAAIYANPSGTISYQETKNRVVIKDDVLVQCNDDGENVDAGAIKLFYGAILEMSGGKIENIYENTPGFIPAAPGNFRGSLVVHGESKAIIKGGQIPFGVFNSCVGTAGGVYFKCPMLIRIWEDITTYFLVNYPEENSQFSIFFPESQSTSIKYWEDNCYVSKSMGFNFGIRPAKTHAIKDLPIVSGGISESSQMQVQLLSDTIYGLSGEEMLFSLSSELQFDRPITIEIPQLLPAATLTLHSGTIPGKKYDGTELTHSTENNELFSWDNEGTIRYTYYTDNQGTMTSTADGSGAKSLGASPKNPGTYFLKAFLPPANSWGSASSDYLNFTILPEFTTAKVTMPKSGNEVSIAGSNIITYGDTLSKILLSPTEFVDEDGNAVDGTLTWQDVSSIPNAGFWNATWVFTPFDQEQYAPSKGTLLIVIYRKTVNIPELPAQIPYDGSEHICTIPKQKEYRIVSDKSVMQATKVGAYNITLELTDNANYQWMDGRTDNQLLNWSIELAEQPIYISDVAKTFRKNAQFQLNTTAPGKVTYKVSDSSKSAEVTAAGKVTMKAPGTCEVIVSAAPVPGKYVGAIKTIKLTFNQMPVQAITGAKVAGLKNKNETGKKIMQSITVSLNGDKLKYGTDYTTSYLGNLKPGTAKITISGKGRYSKSITRTFQIYAKKGKTYTIGNYKYRVTNSNIKGKGTVSVSGMSIKLTSVTIPSTVKIGNITYKVTGIDKKAFYKKKAIKAVTIGKNIVSIGESAFSGCSSLKKIKITATKLKTVGSNCFLGINKKAVISLPSKKVEAYHKVLANKGQTSSVKIKR